MSVVSFIDGHRQWYKAYRGLGACEVPRKESFCQYTIEGVDPLIIRDASEHPKFMGHPAVVGAPYVRFYAGLPLRTGEGTMSARCAGLTRCRGRLRRRTSIFSVISPP